MKTVYQLFVNGIPKAQPRPRMTVNGHVYNPSSADAWKEEVKAAFISCRRPMITEPIRLKVYFFMPVPKGMKIVCKDGHYMPHIKKPDADNLLKAVMDALTEVGVWKDDALAFWTEAVKFYAANENYHEKTGAQIIIETGF
ncbi:MAG: RusA family crossover junction endodeoxyribonuclease [Treponema sp.]|jgi:Holliday junction resolvase RusA-like endonuclease|nr:RusA family crossover junction endodeoxyribonuclease [Treponema sp.]